LFAGIQIQKLNSKLFEIFLIPKPFSSLPCSSSLSAHRPLLAQPAHAAAQHRAARQLVRAAPASPARQLARPAAVRPSRPSKPPTPAHRFACAASAVADRWGPPVIPFLATGSTRTPPPPAPSPPRVRVLARSPHAKVPDRAIERCHRPLDLLPEQPAPPFALAASRRKP
jgi:hypothetical protein